MKSMYPKRIIMIIAICTIILALFAVLDGTNYIRENGHNMTAIDQKIFYYLIGFNVVAIICSVLAIKNSAIGWIGFAVFSIFSIVQIILAINNLGAGSYPIAIFLPFIIVLLITVIFLFTDRVRKYFQVNFSHMLIVVVLSGLSYYVLSIDPLEDKSKVSDLYIEYIDDQVYLNNEKFTGMLYSKYPNSNLSYIGSVMNGNYDGDWKEYFEDGKIKSTYCFLERGLVGKEVLYFSSGEIREETNYKDGVEDGNYELWLTPEFLHITGNFVDGSKDGEWKKYEVDMVETSLFHLDTLIESNWDHREVQD